MRSAPSAGLTAFSRVAVFIVIFAAGAAAGAQTDDLINADRPGIADSGQVIDRGTFQVEAGTQREGGRTTVPVLVRYGLTNRIELRADSETLTRQQHTTALAPLSLGFKTQLTEMRERGTLQDFGLIGRLTLPSGSGVSRQEKASAQLVAAADLNSPGKWVVNPNAGAAMYHDAAGQSRVAPVIAVTVEYDVTQRIRPAFEIAHVAPDEGENDGRTVVDVQFAWIVAHDVQLDVEAGRNVKQSSDHYVTAGVSVRFR